MNAADAEIMRNIRRELAKRPMDVTRLDLQVVHGRVMMGGIVSRLRDHPNADIQSELDMLIKILSRDRLIKDVTSGVRVLKEENKPSEDTNTRGRMRH